MIPAFKLKPDVEVGDLLTTVSILIALAGLLIALMNDRKARRREYADRIRKAAALSVAGLERWAAILQQFYDDVQPLFTRTDEHLVKTQDAIVTRDYLWHGLLKARSTTLHRVFAEKVELAYAGLYGYDSRVEALYKVASSALRDAEEEAFYRLLAETQIAVMQFVDSKGRRESAELGNQLREISAGSSVPLHSTSSAVVAEFRSAMVMLLDASDTALVKKRISLPAASPSYSGSAGKAGRSPPSPMPSAPTVHR